jgi:hypothetical protein
MTDVPLTLGPRTIPVPPLPASNSNGSQGLNRSRPLTHSLTHQLPPFRSTELNWTRFTPLYSLCSPKTDHAENAALLLLRACVMRPLPRNCLCLQSHHLATGLLATIRRPRVPLDSDIRMTALARTSSNCKGRTFLSSEMAHLTSANLQLSESNKNLVLDPRWGLRPR